MVSFKMYTALPHLSGVATGGHGGQVTPGATSGERWNDVWKKIDTKKKMLPLLWLFL